MVKTARSGMRVGQKWLLSALLCANAGAALLALTASVATDFWLVTFEWEAARNGTVRVTAVHSGLWRWCSEQKLLPSGRTTVFQWTAEALEYTGDRDNCTRHNATRITDGLAFRHRRAGGDMKPTDIHVVQAASPLPLAGSLLAAVASAAALWGACQPRASRLVMVGGALFVVSGLCLLIGIVLYIGNVSQAFDGSSGGVSADQKCAYAYGYSFHLCVSGFAMAESAGVLAVYLHLARSRHIKSQSAAASASASATPDWPPPPANQESPTPPPPPPPPLSPLPPLPQPISSRSWHSAIGPAVPRSRSQYACDCPEALSGGGGGGGGGGGVTAVARQLSCSGCLATTGPTLQRVGASERELQAAGMSQIQLLQQSGDTRAYFYYHNTSSSSNSTHRVMKSTLV